MTTELTLATSETLSADSQPETIASPEKVAEEAGSILMDQISNNALEPQEDGMYMTGEGIKVIWTPEADSYDSRGYMQPIE